MDHDDIAVAGVWIAFVVIIVLFTVGLIKNHGHVCDPGEHLIVIGKVMMCVEDK